MYDIATSLVETVTKSEQERLGNYVLVPFNDPDFYPMLVTFNGTILLRHLNIIHSHGASGGKVVYIYRIKFLYLHYSISSILIKILQTLVMYGMQEMNEKNPQKFVFEVKS